MRDRYQVDLAIPVLGHQTTCTVTDTVTKQQWQIRGNLHGSMKEWADDLINKLQYTEHWRIL